MQTDHHAKDKNAVLSTRERILNAAGELFAYKGFSATTIRDICEKADANVAAVNYHFRDKEGLYKELVILMEQEIRKTFIDAFHDHPEASIEERLYDFIFHFLHRRLDPDRAAWKAIFFHHEIMQPSSTAVQILSELIQKEQALLMLLTRELTAREFSDDEVLYIAQSIFGQGFFYFHFYGGHFHHLLHSLKDKIAFELPQPEVTLELIKRQARHITDFSLAAIAELKRRKNSEEGNR